ncbi:hypothetical protein BDA99DRAFT_534452 [Phascolomyces articulosus]|uniref:Uncharacterized protein n=1 Tax=Phascolomyces articulosus TaxID=60185 RepID=A0AAD5K577_9FUNG|nr:hypothetical protein BDA99DRAFT_534452 [Phascolomyces articulosus]
MYYPYSPSVILRLVEVWNISCSSSSRKLSEGVAGNFGVKRQDLSIVSAQGSLKRKSGSFSDSPSKRPVTSFLDQDSSCSMKLADFRNAVLSRIQDAPDQGHNDELSDNRMFLSTT